MPAASREEAPDTWALSTEGRAEARALVAALPPDSLLFSTDERKAWETLRGSSEVTRDPRFNEIKRRGEPWDVNFRERRRHYLEGTAHRGWEPQAEAVARFDAGVAEVLQKWPTVPVVIATHGMVLTMWLVRRGALAQAQAVHFWSALWFPDCFLLEGGGQSMRRYP